MDKRRLSHFPREAIVSLKGRGDWGGVRKKL